jgi:hypothetical protein
VAELVRGLTMILGRARGDLIARIEQDWRLARARLAGQLGGRDR